MKRILVAVNILLMAICVSFVMEREGEDGPAQSELTGRSRAAARGAEPWAARAQEDRKTRRFRLDTGQVVTLEELEALSAGPPATAPFQDTNIRVNESGPAAEITVLINPVDPDNIVAAAMDSSTLAVRATPYVSFDEGATWDQRQPVSNFFRAPDGTTGMFQNQSDPVLTADGQGNIYLAVIMWDPEAPDNGVYVFKSNDGGRRFFPGVPVLAHIGELDPPFEDKEWIAADTTGGPFNDSLYITWTSIGPVRQILFSRSTDGGGSFSEPFAINDQLSTRTSVQGSMPKIGPDGEVYVIWRRFISGRGFQVVVDKSTDGGATFGQDVTISRVIGFGRLTGLARHGGTLPALAVDRSSGPTRGNLYIIWADGRNGDVDILLARSTDGGQTWSHPARVNDDELGNGKDQFMPFVTVDQVTGDVVVGYYDRRESVENIFVDYRIMWSRDGGVTFEPSVKLTDQPFDPSAAFRFIQAARFLCQAPFMGDYTSLVARDGTVFPLWADTRNGRSDIFTRPMPIR